MKLAIVADSHGRFDRLGRLLARLEEEGVSHLIHAGDGAVYELVDVFSKYPNIKIYFALGNCDVNPEVIEKLDELANVEIQEVVQVNFDDIKIGVSHIEGVAEEQLRNEKIRIFCHGHTHRRKTEERDGKIILNPGALTEDGSYFVLELPTMKLEQRRID